MCSVQLEMCSCAPFARKHPPLTQAQGLLHLLQGLPYRVAPPGHPTGAQGGAKRDDHRLPKWGCVDSGSCPAQPSRISCASGRAGRELGLSDGSLGGQRRLECGCQLLRLLLGLLVLLLSSLQYTCSNTNNKGTSSLHSVESYAQEHGGGCACHCHWRCRHSTQMCCPAS